MKWNEITEAIPLSVGKKYNSKTADKTMYDSLFNKYRDHIIDRRAQRLKFDLGKNDEVSNNETLEIMKEIYYYISKFNDLEYFPDMMKNKTSETMKLITSHPLYQKDEDLRYKYKQLRNDKLDTKLKEDYVKGVIEIKGREVRIGKILNQIIKWYENKLIPTMELEEFDNVVYVKEMLDNIKNTRRKFEMDKTRFGKGTKNISVIISRHPYDIAGASTGRSWTSCLNLEDGTDRHFIKDYVENSLIAYLVDSEDINISNPHGRIWINRYFNSEGDFILMNSDGYGNVPKSFKDFVQKFVMEFNNGKADGLYCAKPSAQYDHVKYTKRNKELTQI